MKTPAMLKPSWCNVVCTARRLMSLFAKKTMQHFRVDLTGGGRLHDPHTPGQGKAIGVVMARMPFSY